MDAAAKPVAGEHAPLLNRPPPAVSRLLRREEVVLAVVDLQARLVPAIAGAPALLRACRRIIRTCDLLGVPTLFTEQYPQGLGPTVPEVADLFAGRQPVAKTTFGCFACPDFVRAIEQTGRRSLLLAGVEAHICVFQTALQALTLGFDVYVLEDAVGARTDGARQTGLSRLNAAGAVPSHTEMASYELLGTAGTPEFRSALAIVKEEAE